MAAHALTGAGTKNLRTTVPRLIVATPRSFGSKRNSESLLNDILTRNGYDTVTQRYGQRRNVLPVKYEPYARQDTKEHRLIIAMLRRGADPDIRTSEGVPLLIQAIKWDDRTMFDALLKAGADVNTQVGETQHRNREKVIYRPLVTACEALDRWDYQNNPYPERKNEERGRISHRAYFVAALLAKGANVNLRDSRGWDAIRAMTWQYPDGLNVLQQLLKAGARVKGRADVLVSVPTRAFQILIHAGANVNAKIDSNEYLLHRYVGIRYDDETGTKFIRRSLIAGANPNPTDSKGMTPLDVLHERYFWLVKEEKKEKSTYWGERIKKWKLLLRKMARVLRVAGGRLKKYANKNSRHDNFMNFVGFGDARRSNE